MKSLSKTFFLLLFFTILYNLPLFSQTDYQIQNDSVYEPNQVYSDYYNEIWLMYRKSDSSKLTGFVKYKTKNLVRFIQYKDGVRDGFELEYDFLKKSKSFELCYVFFYENCKPKYQLEFYFKNNNEVSNYTVYYPNSDNFELIKVTYDFKNHKEIDYRYNPEFHLKSKWKFKLNDNKYHIKYVEVQNYLKHPVFNSKRLF
jgi:hypothetical protein